MGEAKRRRQQEQSAWPRSDNVTGIIDLHVLPSVAAINGARIRALTGDDRIPDTTQVILRAFRAAVDERTFNVGFCLGDGEGFSAIGIAVIDRLMMEAPEAALHVVPFLHKPRREPGRHQQPLGPLAMFGGAVVLDRILHSFPCAWDFLGGPRKGDRREGGSGVGHARLQSEGERRAERCSVGGAQLGKQVRRLGLGRTCRDRIERLDHAPRRLRHCPSRARVDPRAAHQRFQAHGRLAQRGSRLRFPEQHAAGQADRQRIFPASRFCRSQHKRRSGLPRRFQALTQCVPRIVGEAFEPI